MTREDHMAAIIADGVAVHVAGSRMGLTKSQTARVWSNIKRAVGEQAK